MHPYAPPPNNDAQHLQILAICHYIYAAFTALTSCVFLIHLAMGTFFVVAAPQLEVKDEGERMMLQVMGGFFMVLASIALVVGLTFSLLKFFVGRYLQARRGYYFCFTIAVLECLSMPLGTVLGIFTLVVLTRTSVRQLFGVEPAGKPVY